MKEPKLVEIVWHDILDSGSDWVHGEEMPKPVTVKTVGYIVEKKKSHITLTRDFYHLDGKRTLGGIITIPKGVIMQINELAAKS